LMERERGVVRFSGDASPYRDESGSGGVRPEVEKGGFRKRLGGTRQSGTVRLSGWFMKVLHIRHGFIWVHIGAYWFIIGSYWSIASDFVF
jgi:hypothetical protein